MAVKVVGKRYFEKSPVDSADNLRVKNSVGITLSRCLRNRTHFCILRRNSRWPPNVAGKRFWGKVASRVIIYPAGQNFIEIALSHFCIKRRNSRWPPKVAGKLFFCEKSPVDSKYTLWVKNFVEIALSCSVSEINAFLFFQR